MDEDLEVHPQGGELGNLLDGELAGQGHAAKAQLAGELDAAGVADVHLGGAVQLELGQLLAQALGKAHVLDDGGVDAGLCGRADQAQGLVHLAGHHEGVGGEVDLAAPQVGVAAGGGEVCRSEVVCVAAGVEALTCTEVDGVCTGSQGRLEGLPVAGRCQKLGFSHNVSRPFHRASRGRAPASGRQAAGPLSQHERRVLPPVVPRGGLRPRAASAQPLPAGA